MKGSAAPGEAWEEAWVLQAQPWVLIHLKSKAIFRLNKDWVRTKGLNDLPQETPPLEPWAGSDLSRVEIKALSGTSSQEQQQQRRDSRGEFCDTNFKDLHGCSRPALFLAMRYDTGTGMDNREKES